VLAAIPNTTILAGRTLTVTNFASDTDVPAQTLIYGMAGAPTGATINTNTGLLTWRPAMAQAPSTNLLSVTVIDSGVPPLSATQSFYVTVARPATPVLTASGLSNGQFRIMVSGDAGPDYYIDAATNLAAPVAWRSVFTNLSPGSMPFLWTDPQGVSALRRFYRARLGP
jgi:hypothetical protein